MCTAYYPGPCGFKARCGPLLSRGPIGFDPDYDLKHSYLTPGPMGTGRDASVAAAEFKAQETADENELKLLVKTYRSLKNKSGKKSYTYWKKKKRRYRTAEYVADRNAFFGGRAAYLEFLEASRKELDANKEKLRRYIEPNKKRRKKVKGWKKAQDVFYAWVRKAYQKKLGEDVDVPKLIRVQMSDKMKAALKQVKLDFGKSFQHGGFNPRPMKLNGYRLGTISEHAIGTAIDIESAKNAHIPTLTWKHIQIYTGKSLSTATRKAKWKTAPKELHDSIKEINDEFVSRLKQAMKDAAGQAAKSAAAPGASEKVKAEAKAAQADLLGAAIKADPQLKHIGATFLKRWKNGFFNLPWTLVKELQEEGLLWGATFSHPDLHHFEL